jgi:hypothetical protein
MTKISKKAVILLIQAYYIGLDEDMTKETAIMWAEDWASYDKNKKEPFDLENGLLIDHKEGFWLREPTEQELEREEFIQELSKAWSREAA